MKYELIVLADGPLGPVADFSAVGWYTLLAGAGAAILLGVGAVAYFQQRRSEPRHTPALMVNRAERAWMRAELADMVRESVRLTTTARMAAAAHHQARTQCDTTERAVAVTERAYESAQQEYRTAAAAALEAAASPTAGKVADASAERDIAAAALGAYRRGDITVEDLRKVWFTASGWDAGREEVEHDLLRLRSAELTARRAYHGAVAAARVARRAEEIADVAAKAVAAEAAAAAMEVARARRR